MNEWEFTGEAAGWFNERIHKNPSSLFSGVRVEQRGEGSSKRRDLTFLDKNKIPILTGEVKLPYAKDGSTPYNDTVVTDARAKALKAGASFFFTWNVNEFVLWETTPGKTTSYGEKYRSWLVTAVYKESRLDIEPTRMEIQTWIDRFLVEFTDIIRGTAPIGFKPPDERFIDLLESALFTPIMMTFEVLLSRYPNHTFKKDLDEWMREEGWTILDDQEGINDNLERASKYACYALVNKLVFHEALLKRYSSRLTRLVVPDHIDTGEQLRLHLETYFAQAKTITGDYETVFGEDHKAIENRIPFYSDSATVHWRELINQIHKFDFSKIDYEVIGRIFERLISPEERHKYGKYYTRAEVVDLINSFCIRDGTETVMDPACGGGTFLVRAYARKKELAPARKHVQLLADLFGIDISHFATHLTTINLATRDLIDEENYPQIARSDFFDVAAQKTFISLPKRVEAKTLGKRRDVIIPPLDAVISNPPYVRQEDIPKTKKESKSGPRPGTKEYYQQVVKNEVGITLSGRADLHCYFWPHSASFLKQNGFLCLLTSSQWLDVEYGFRLQEWILQNFRILAIFESLDEPWFVGARVATAITCLQAEVDETERINNFVRFIQLRRPIGEILAHDGTSAGVVTSVDRFRDEIMSLTENGVNERYRARLVKQHDLWKQGVELGALMSNLDSSDGEDEDEEQKNQAGFSNNKYYGGKWGIHVRAPDLWFNLIDSYGKLFTPLGNMSTVHRGITSGKDSFFFPVDCSIDCLKKYDNPPEFIRNYGVPRERVESGHIRLVKCGDHRGEIHPIEAQYTEPELHNIMGVERFTIAPTDCSRLVVLLAKHKSDLKGTAALKYVLWGESKNIHKEPTCAGRTTSESTWYDLTRTKRADIILPKIQQYRLLSILNPSQVHIGSSLLGLYNVPAEQVIPLCAVLNSTISILSRILFARILGNEGNIQLDVYSAKMMLVPDIRVASRSQLQRISQAFASMKDRKSLTFVSEKRLRTMAFTGAGKVKELDSLSDATELDMPDRRDLDDAVLEMVGVKSPKQRDKIIDELYTYLRHFFEATRQKEEKAIINKNTARRRERIRPADIASQIYEDISKNDPELLRRYEVDFLDNSQPFDSYDLPTEGDAIKYSDLLVPQGVKFTKGTKSQVNLIPTLTASQAELIVLLTKTGRRGLVRVPHDDLECARTLASFQSFIEGRDARLLELVQERTSDEETQEKTLVALASLLNR
ncbi:N-6 DNA Methylase [Dehalogenimonas formicexedens]|uniref:site-specific DNA-methyltransferase (adenine-specific) n=1 Tax=Dehalogenimonas formicexedens TaxID=1839801 RepID=A0A1P8F6Q2_9CHLR|nr:N-6 DNA methylase [Dehalogenimonas formicexedens]APV44161.1 N-6 DNA Methylase [Dehalogenimonas formicexedens]